MSMGSGNRSTGGEWQNLQAAPGFAESPTASPASRLTEAIPTPTPPLSFSILPPSSWSSSFATKLKQIQLEVCIRIHTDLHSTHYSHSAVIHIKSMVVGIDQVYNCTRFQSNVSSERNNQNRSKAGQLPSQHLPMLCKQIQVLLTSGELQVLVQT